MDLVVVAAMFFSRFLEPYERLVESPTQRRKENREEEEEEVPTRQQVAMNRHYTLLGAVLHIRHSTFDVRRVENQTYPQTKPFLGLSLLV